ncbi:4-(cytidine 5'-diphospho)-2-C-methyl-D-erythritol kinase [Rhodoferax sp. PAMC 29310]|uniref:4-(cytidine 5'-diphospho)-2-C-methyl-D-erythritol kinase n=1 Tax=Rhodoferax sp. PAMC 29310 TaxID=2822760 RepID=UPI001B341C81|nr:4-(cytidine 5'-diphospho)-2-C-methyl-D-erythritol kinase [Rhodoferax sp. PAMC 29310]
MKAIYDICAPAKLNRFLHITGRRDDGYHLLQSVFMLVDWCDTLHMETRADGKITREDLCTALPPDDLIVKAARALQAATKTSLGAHIGIEKKIPAQAGMGGGSSDAASTLLALNQLWNTQLSVKHLMQIGLQLGADVPFFLSGGNAWVEGIGDIISPVKLTPAQFLVIKPENGVETKAIFMDTSLKRDTKRAIISGFAEEDFDFGQNDMQDVALRLCPGIQEAIGWLSTIGLRGRMTGSGSAVFAHMPKNLDLRGAPSGFQIKACNMLDVHPLSGWAKS